MSKVQFRSFCLFVGCLMLAGCSDKNDAASKANAPSVNMPGPTMTRDAPDRGVSKFTLADGPDVCFRAVAQQLGPNTKVSQLTSLFSPGKVIDPSASAPAGEMIICTVQYQSPQDPRKLLEISMDVKTGTFSGPRPVEITVMGGDAAKFNLEDHLIRLGEVNAAGLKAVMDGQKASMDKTYSKHAWSGVRLVSPGAFDRQHTLRLDIDGRIATNDIKGDGYASMAIDGKTIIRNFLKP
jgi:hypothetical protein